MAGIDENNRAGLLSVTDLRHPIFRPFGPLSANLGQVRFERTWRIRPEGWDVAARFSDGTPALLERGEGRGRIVLFASDFDRRWNDFPVQPSFVPFVVEAVRYVSGARAGSGYLVGGAPEGVPARPGVFRNPRVIRSVAVNVDPRETEPTRLAPESLPPRPGNTQAISRLGCPLPGPPDRGSPELLAIWAAPDDRRAGCRIRCRQSLIVTSSDPRQEIVR